MKLRQRDSERTGRTADRTGPHGAADRRVGDQPVGIPFDAHVTSGTAAATVRIAGELDASTAPALGPILSRAGVGGRTVLLDLDETTYIDSAGIRILVRSARQLAEVGSKLQVIAVSPEAERILSMTGILEALKEPEA